MLEALNVLKINFVLPFYSSRPVVGLKVVYEYANHLSSWGHSVTVIHPRLLPTIQTPQKLHQRARMALGVRYREIVHPRGVSWQTIHERVRMLYVPSLDTKYIPESHA